MKQTAVEWLAEALSLAYQIEKISLRDFTIKKLIKQAKEMENQKQGYSEEEVELIANEMVNWAIENIGNPNPQSGKKFDEVMVKLKKK